MNRLDLAQSTDVVDDSIVRGFITKVYGWMSLALVITGLVAISTASNPTFMRVIFGTPLMLVIIIVQLIMVVVLGAAIGKLSASVATGIFILYSALTGVTFSTLFLVYTGGSIAQGFFVTAGTFGLVSAYGYITRRDLTSIGNLLFMALIGLIAATVVNLFLRSTMLDLIVTCVGVLIFVGLIAYDTQRIKRMAISIGNDGDIQRKAAVLGALTLYLDFINLFLRLLRLFGKRR